MTTHSKRVAAAALSVALGFGGAAAIATGANAAPTATATPTKSPTAKPGNPKQLIATEFRDEAGKDGTVPTYQRLYDSSTTLDSRGTLYTEAGAPLANRTIAIYDYSTGKRGKMLGAGTTDANGKFAFSVPLPSGWSDNPNFNVELAYDDTSGVYESAALYLKPQSSGTATPTKSPTATKTATKSPTKAPSTTKKPTTPPTKDTTGGLAKTGN